MGAVIVACVAVGGALVGAAVTWWATRRAARGRDNSVPDAVTSVSGVTQPSSGPAPLEEALDHLEAGVTLLDRDGRVRFRNREASTTDGTHSGVLIDEHVRTLARAAQTLDDDASVQRLVELQGPPKKWYDVTASRVADDGAIVTVRDVSERVRLDAVRTDFVTNVSHELKTPVGALAVLAEALIGEDDPEVIARVAGRLVDEAYRAVRTIDDLLELSQIESTGPSESTDAPVDLAAVLEHAVARGRAVDGGRGVQIHALDTPRALFVRGHERQLQSAVGNLVENAVKYSHDGGTVQVRARVNADAVEVMVADQGVGIPARDLDRVFERFYRVDRARSRATGGTGLGLAIVRHVATNHGGEVLVSSHEGEGSTFVLRLPGRLLVTDTAERQVVEER